MIRPIERVRRWWQGDEHASSAPAASPEGSASLSSSNGAGMAVGAGGRIAALAQPEPVRRVPPWVETLERAGIPRTLQYPATTLGRLLDQTADRFGDATAIVYNESRWSYRELLARVNRMAGGLASLGVRRGERVLMVLPNCPEFVITFFAIQKLGAVAVNVGPLMGVDDLKQVIAMTTPRVAVGLDLQAPALAHVGDHSTLEHWVWVSLQGYQPVFKRLGYQFKLWHHRNGSASTAQHMLLNELLEHAPSRPPTVEPDAARPAVLQATGGTTGTLKLAELTHRSLLANTTQVATLMGCRPGQERVLAVLPMFHVYGLTTCMMSGVYSAATMILSTRFNADETLELLREHRPTIFPLVPAICDAISDRLERENRVGDGFSSLSDLRLCLSGAAPLPAATAERFERLTGAKVIEGYGLTEASPVTHANLPDKARAGSIGLPMPDTRVRVVDLEDPARDVPVGQVGEMLICGPQIMRGYFANAEHTARALFTDDEGRTWLRTGDLARYDEDGFFYIVDRRKDMIIRSGLKVYPNKVEKVLRTHAKVADAAVVGRPHPVHTETVVAVLAMNDGPPDDTGPLCDELRALCREHLSPYEVPEEFEFVAELPRSPLGKLLKRELRKAPATSGANEALLPGSGNGHASGNGNGNGNGNGHAGSNGKSKSGKPAKASAAKEARS
jgi:long-chain acyl-CoA synthetase